MTLEIPTDLWPMFLLADAARMVCASVWCSKPQHHTKCGYKYQYSFHMLSLSSALVVYKSVQRACHTTAYGSLCFAELPDEINSLHSMLGSSPLGCVLDAIANRLPIRANQSKVDVPIRELEWLAEKHVLYRGHP